MSVSLIGSVSEAANAASYQLGAGVVRCSSS